MTDHPFTLKFIREFNLLQISCDYMLCQLGNGSFHTYNMPWAERTVCDTGMWCQRRKCVKERNPMRINGGWSQWKS